MAHLEGDWETERAINERGLAEAPLDAQLLCSRVLLEYEVGDFVQGEGHLERLVDAVQLLPMG